MRPSAKYGLKCVTVVTPTPYFGVGLSKKHGSADTVIMQLGHFFELIPKGTANSEGNFSKIMVRIWREVP